MDTTEDLPAARIRERRAKTYRCYLSRGDAVIDVDAFTLDEAVALAAAHWNVGADQVDVDQANPFAMLLIAILDPQHDNGSGKWENSFPERRLLLSRPSFSPHARPSSRRNTNPQSYRG